MLLINGERIVPQGYTILSEAAEDGCTSWLLQATVVARTTSFLFHSDRRLLKVKVPIMPPLFSN